MSKETSKGIHLSIRLNEDQYERTRRACYRDELKVREFIRDCINEGTQRLIDKQDKFGFSLSQKIL